MLRVLAVELYTSGTYVHASQGTALGTGKIMSGTSERDSVLNKRKTHGSGGRRHGYLIWDFAHEISRRCVERSRIECALEFSGVTATFSQADPRIAR